MTSGRRRWLSKTAATLLLLTGMTIPASPASAVDPDGKFTFDLTSTTVSLGTLKKTVYLRFTNLTDEASSQIRFHVGSFGPEWDFPDGGFKATVEWADRGGVGECDGDWASWGCDINSVDDPHHIPAPGGTVEIPITITVSPRMQEPFEGKFRVSASMSWGEGKPVESSKWFTLNVVDYPEADLSVVAPDVTRSVPINPGRIEPAGPLTPGKAGAVYYMVANHGRKAVSGIKVTLRLPEGVAFIQPEEACEIDSGGRTAICTYDTLALVPADEENHNEDLYSAVQLSSLIKVPADTRAPVTLKGGVVQVEGLTERAEPRSAAKRTRLPANAVAVPAADVDASDNQDGFAVVIAALPSDGDDGGGGGGGLPVTGPPAGLITGAGLAMLAGGGIMLFLARRRNRLPHA
ncbi:hypothetical protein Vqi01_29430 [Micromonospora qiuiae]|uniref:LPXTG cell wall anchor domain-containing protein n=1 Tax=Micromonospora qiuiae TaxID=502268 RepID=A0ABQ4JC77_9ACTN|nr:hypothetical protein [Micromonospora qiuiae]GIJ27781.1 hypothetical protein Vqi01_29430 [Micromonospora qiuiae]